MLEMPLQRERRLPPRFHLKTATVVEAGLGCTRRSHQVANLGAPVERKIAVATAIAALAGPTRDFEALRKLLHLATVAQRKAAIAVAVVHPAVAGVTVVWIVVVALKIGAVAEVGAEDVDADLVVVAAD